MYSNRTTQRAAPALTAGSSPHRGHRKLTTTLPHGDQPTGRAAFDTSADATDHRVAQRNRTPGRHAQQRRPGGAGGLRVEQRRLL